MINLMFKFNFITDTPF